MMSFFRTIPVAEATGKLKALYDEDVRLHGRVCGAAEMLSLRPEVSAAWHSLAAAAHCQRYVAIKLLKNSHLREAEDRSAAGM